MFFFKINQQEQRRVCLFILAIMIAINLCKGQVAIDNAVNLYKKNPETYFLKGKVDFPINHTTGNPDISIDLFTLELKNLKIPLKLAYRSYGFLVNNESSEIGLGWNLEFGGRIVQEGRGYFDQNNENQFASYANSTNKLLMPNCPYTGPTIPNQDCNSDYIYMFNVLGSPIANYRYTPVSPGPYPDYVFKYLGTGVGNTNFLYDFPNSEVDLFYFSIPNRSGKYFYGLDGKTHQIPFSKIKIENNSITDLDGNKYFFHISSGVGNIYRGYRKIYKSGSIEGGTLENSYSSHSQDVNNQITNFLSEIKTQTGDIVTFEYLDSRYSSHDPTLISIRNENNVYNYQNGYVNNSASYFNQIQWSRRQNISKLISKVKVNGVDLIEFEYASEVRKDVYYETDNFTKTRSLKKIIVKNLMGEIIKNIVLDQSYFGFNASIDNDQDKTSRQYRLKLNSIKINSSEEYKFNYIDDGYQLPSKSQVDQKDHWGFFNGMNYPIPLNPTLEYVNNLIGSHREPNLQASTQTLIKTIKYPSGGLDSFEYELNEGCGGLRLKSIKTLSDRNITLLRKFLYTNGKLYYKPIYTYTNSFWNIRQQSRLPSGANIMPSFQSVLYSSAMNDINGYAGSPIYYPDVTEIQEDPISMKPLGKMEFNYTYFADIIGEGSTQTNRLKKTIDYGWKRGHLLSKSSYEYTSGDVFTLKERITNDYNFDDTAIDWSDAVHPDRGFPTSLKANEYQYNSYNVSLQRPEIEYEVSGNDIQLNLVAEENKAFFEFSLERLISSSFYRIKEKIEKFESNGTILEERTFAYDNPAHAQITSMELKSSSGRTDKTEFKYLLDLKSTHPYSESTYDEMANRNMISIPLLTKRVVNGKIIEQQRKEYGTFGGSILPKLYFVEIGKNSYEGGPLEAYKTYDKFGNLNEIEYRKNYSQVYLWGYSGRYPIVEIENATYAEVATVLTQAVIDNLNSNSHTEATMETLIKNVADQLRTDIPKAMVTSFTYKPLVGMTSKTDARGIKETYTYDGMQRLQAILDHLNNINRSFDYHYRPN